MEPRLRRPYLVEPGEGLLISTDITKFASHCTQFMDDTGLEPEEVVAAPVAGFPIPKAIKGTDGRILSWEGVRSQMMWHPFFWLPESIALRYELIMDEEGTEKHVETDDEWALRVITSCVSAGVIDVKTGTWLNVFEYAGLTENEELYARVDEWLSGGYDAELDAITLAPLFDGEPHDDGVACLSDAPLMVAAQWAATGHQVAEVIEQAESDAEVSLHNYPVEMVAAHAILGYSGDPDLQDGSKANKVISEALQALEDEQIDRATMAEILKQISIEIATSYGGFLESVADAAGQAHQRDQATVAAVQGV